MHSLFRISFFVAASVPAAGLVRADAVPPLPFSEAVFTEIVNDVRVLDRADALSAKAVLNAKFLAPDLVKTGRKSRAQLTAADGTIARVGSNAVFSFDRSGRSINLEQGSVLFHSPTGKGGGTIVTAAATASVIGTTIIVSATSDGGFKLLVLEGVATVKFPNGSVSTLNAGQMTFVLPEPAAAGASGNQGQGGSQKGGSPGPVLDFDLGALTADSGLVGGFTTELPSVGKIRLAIAGQRSGIASGDLTRTGLFIVGATDKDSFLVADPSVVRAASATIEAANAAAASPVGRFDVAIATTLTLDGVTPIPKENLFLTPIVIPAVDLPSGVTGPNGGFAGVAAGNLTITAPAFSLDFASGLSRAVVLGYNRLTFGNIVFNVPAGVPEVSIVGGTLVIPSGSSVAVDFAGRRHWSHADLGRGSHARRDESGRRFLREHFGEPETRLPGLRRHPFRREHHRRHPGRRLGPDGGGRHERDRHPRRRARRRVEGLGRSRRGHDLGRDADGLRSGGRERAERGEHHRAADRLRQSGRHHVRVFRRVAH